MQAASYPTLDLRTKMHVISDALSSDVRSPSGLELVCRGYVLNYYRYYEGLLGSREKSYVDFESLLGMY